MSVADTMVYHLLWDINFVKILLSSVDLARMVGKGVLYKLQFDIALNRTCLSVTSRTSILLPAYIRSPG